MSTVPAPPSSRSWRWAATCMPRCPPTRTSTPTPRPAAMRCCAPASPGKRKVEEVIAALSDGGLRGLGGAGFPTGRKWGLVRAEKGPRLMAVNGDEGEPGTFKDRYYLEREPHKFLEGALIAAWAVEAAEVFIYIRDEYPAVLRILAKEIAEAGGGGAFQAHQAHRPPRRRRLHLRRGERHDRVDRGQAGPAAPPPALRGAGRRVRPADARQQHRDALLGAGDPGEGRGVVRLAGQERRQGPALLLGVGPREEAGRGADGRRLHLPRT